MPSATWVSLCQKSELLLFKLLTVEETVFAGDALYPKLVDDDVVVSSVVIEVLIEVESLVLINFSVDVIVDVDNVDLSETILDADADEGIDKDC